MVDERSDQSDPTTSQGGGDGIWWVLPLVMLIGIVALRVLFGSSERADPMTGISSLEVRGLLNQAYPDLTVDEKRLSSTPFGETEETRFAISCRMMVEDSDKPFSGTRVIPIPEQFLEGLSQGRDSFKIRPFSLRSGWAQGVEFKEIEQVSCSVVVPITGAPGAVLILERDDLKVSLDPKSSLVKVSEGGVDTDIAVPPAIGSILKGARFTLVVTGNKQGTQFGEIKTLESISN